MLSPFMWAAELTYEVAETRNVPHHTGWAIMATVVAAWFALEVLVATLASFDRRLGRISDGTTDGVAAFDDDANLVRGLSVARGVPGFFDGKKLSVCGSVTLQFALGNIPGGWECGVCSGRSRRGLGSALAGGAIRDCSDRPRHRDQVAGGDTALAAGDDPCLVHDRGLVRSSCREL